MALLTLLIVSIVSGELSVFVTGMPYPQMSTESGKAVIKAVDEVPGVSAIDLVEQIAQGEVPMMEQVAPAQEVALLTEKSVSTQTPVDPAPIAQVVLPTEKLPVVEPVALPVDKVTQLAEAELSLEKAPQLAQAELSLEKVPQLGQGELSLEKAPQLAQAELPLENVPQLAKAELSLEKVPQLVQAELSLEKVPQIAQAELSLEKVPQLAQAELSLEKVPQLVQAELSLEKAPQLAQAELPLEKVPSGQVDDQQQMNMQNIESMDNAPVSSDPTQNADPGLEQLPVYKVFQLAHAELPLEKVPSGQTDDQQQMNMQNIESMDNAPASLDPVAHVDPGLERLAKLLIKSEDNAPALQVMESVNKVPSSESVDKASSLSIADGEPLDRFPVHPLPIEPVDAGRDFPELEASIQGNAPAEVPSIEVDLHHPWDSEEDAREQAGQLAYQQYLGIDPLTFAMSEMNTFDDDTDNDQHYVKKRILEVSSEERAINQAYSENIEQRETEREERIRKKSLAIMRKLRT